MFKTLKVQDSERHGSRLVTCSNCGEDFDPADVLDCVAGGGAPCVNYRQRVAR